MGTQRYFTMLGLIALLYAVLGLMLFRFTEAWADSGSGSGHPTVLVARETVSVALKEWHVTPDRPSIPHAGKVTFKVKNAGTVAHEMVVIRTDLPAEALTVAEGKVNEAAAGKVIGEVEEFPPDGKAEITLDLEAGRYVLFCNVLEQGQPKGHYPQGMRAEFTVGSVAKPKH